jgi:hypothetical protein
VVGFSRRDNGATVEALLAEPIPFAELELRIALLPPISRGAHLGGPAIHARRLVQLWRGGEMTAGEIGKASDDELIARRTILTDGAEARAIDAALRARKRSKPIIEEARDREDLKRAWERVRSSKEMTTDAVRNYLHEIELATPKESRPETPKPSDRANYWGDDDVPLSQAFRLLDVEAVARAISRTALISDNDYPNDPIHWPLPPLNDLLPELHDAVWQALLDSELQIEAIPYERGKTGKIPCVIPSIELARLSPDWKLSRLCRGDLDEFVEARVRRAPADTPVETSTEPPVEPEPPAETSDEAPRRQRPSRAQLKAAMEEIAQGYPKDAHPPPFKEIEAALKIRHPGATRSQLREVVAKHAPQLHGERGRPRKSPA